MLVELIQVLSKEVAAEKIGIITPYKEQLKFIKWRLPKLDSYQNIAIGTVDGFQGREKDIILLSCVRASDFQNSLGCVSFIDSR